MKPPFSSKRKQRSKSPSQAMPTAAPDSRTTFAVASRFSCRIGFGTPFGKLPSGSLNTLTISKGRCFSSALMIGPAAPLPVLTTILNGFSALTSTYVRMCLTYSSSTSTSSIFPFGRSSGLKSPSITAFSMSLRPVSLEIGRDSLRTNFIPLYSFGLWLAVIMMPPSSP